MTPHQYPARDSMGEAELVALAQQGCGDAFRIIIQKCNQRLFRVARAVVRNEAEAEDIVQSAYLQAFANLGTFRGEAGIRTWLTRITLNEARGRLRSRRRTVSLDLIDTMSAANANVILFPVNSDPENPEAHAARAQIRRLIEQAIDRLPSPFRIVFVMRDVEECSTQETADALDLPADTVKTRLHRARRLLRMVLDDKVGSVNEAFPFLGVRCQRMTSAVLGRLQFKVMNARVTLQR